MTMWAKIEIIERTRIVHKKLIAEIIEFPIKTIRIIEIVKNKIEIIPATDLGTPVFLYLTQS